MTPTPGGRHWLATLPKVELHVHLEGTIDPATVARLAEAHGEAPPAVLGSASGTYPPRYRSFDHFVEVLVAASGLARTPEDVATIAEAFARGQAAQQVRWTEATFTASTFVDRGMRAEALWAAIRRGFDAVDGVAIGLIVDTIRELGVEAAHRTIELVERADAPIVGLGLTGVEGSVPERDFLPLREAADELGLGLVVHAGETGTGDNVRAALDELGADRIAHGIAVADDTALIDRLARDGTVLDVCPSSNVALGLVPSLDEHPLPRLIDAGLAVTVSSDDPPLFSTTLTDELGHAMRIADLDPAAMLGLQRRAIHASFAPSAVRRAVLAELDDVATGLPAR